MRLAFVMAEAHSATAGGAESVPSLAAALVSAGHDVAVYTPREDPHGDDASDTAEGCRLVRVPAGPVARQARRDRLTHIGDFAQHLEHAWRSHPPDVVHATSWLSGMAGQLAARTHDVPVVQSFDGLAVVERRRPDAAALDISGRLRLESVLARRAQWLAVSSTEETFDLLRMGCVRSRITVVPCGVDSEVFTPAGQVARRGRLPHRIVSIGMSAGRNDFDLVIRALAALTGTELVIAIDVAASAGGAEEIARLRGLADSVGVADRVVVVEIRTAAQLAELLRSADVCACVPAIEPSGAAALAAMSCGVPVIATTVGALADIVVDDVTGRLVPHGDVSAVVDAVRRLLHEPFTGRGMGGAGRDRARARYSWERVAADAARAYSGAVAGGGPKRTTAMVS